MIWNLKNQIWELEDVLPKFRLSVYRRHGSWAMFFKGQNTTLNSVNASAAKLEAIKFAVKQMKIKNSEMVLAIDANREIISVLEEI